MKNIFVFLFFALNYQLSTINYLYAKDYYPYFYDAQSLNGGSGKIINPSTRTVRYKNFALGIHHFQVSISYGVLPQSECGLFFDLKELSKENFNLRQIDFHAKHQFLNQQERYPGLVLGWQENHAYVVSEKFFPLFYRWGLLLGFKFPKKNSKIKIYPFLTIYQTPRWSMFLFDYDSEKKTSNLGWRFLLAPKIKLDLFLTDLQKVKDINNFIFGLTLSS